MPPASLLSSAPGSGPGEGDGAGLPALPLGFAFLAKAFGPHPSSLPAENAPTRIRSCPDAAAARVQTSSIQAMMPLHIILSSRLLAVSAGLRHPYCKSPVSCRSSASERTHNTRKTSGSTASLFGCNSLTDTAGYRPRGTPARHTQFKDQAHESSVDRV